MSDVRIAQSLLHETWPTRAGRPAKVCMSEIFRSLQRVERHLSVGELRQRQRRWTGRRVRAIWDGEARRIDNYEMNDLETAALEAARAEHQKSIERSRRLEIFISSVLEAQGR